MVAIQADGQLITPLSAVTVLQEGGELLALGSQEQRRAFQEAFEPHAGR